MRIFINCWIRLYYSSTLANFVIPCSIANPFLNIYHKKKKSHTNIHSILKHNSKQTQKSGISEMSIRKMNKLWQICPMEYYTAVKINKLEQHKKT